MGCRSHSVWGLLSVGHLTELYTYARGTFLCACQTSMQTSSCSFFNTETLIGSGKIKFKGLYRKIQMLVLKKDFLLCRGCGHVTPFMKNAPPLGVCVCGVVGSRPQSPDWEAVDGVNYLPFLNAYITVTGNSLYHHEGQEVPSSLCMSP